MQQLTQILQTPELQKLFNLLKDPNQTIQQFTEALTQNPGKIVQQLRQFQSDESAIRNQLIESFNRVKDSMISSEQTVAEMQDAITKRAPFLRSYANDFLQTMDTRIQNTTRTVDEVSKLKSFPYQEYIQKLENFNLAPIAAPIAAATALATGARTPTRTPTRTVLPNIPPLTKTAPILAPLAAVTPLRPTTRPPSPRGTGTATVRPPSPRGTGTATVRPPSPRATATGTRPPSPRATAAATRPPSPRTTAAATARSTADLNTLRVPELKDLLKTQGKKVSGTKAELIQRLQEPIV